jgi:cephalosporin hydroxylase
MVEGSSIDRKIAEQIYEIAKTATKVLVCLDSNHTHAHVFEELTLYSKLVSLGSYCIVFDTIVEDLPPDYMPGGRPWNPGNNPKTAVRDFLLLNDQFQIDHSIDNKLLISVAPSGYLKRIK